MQFARSFEVAPEQLKYIINVQMWSRRDVLCMILIWMHPSVRPSEIEYLEIRVHNPYHEDLIELNPRMYAFFKLEDV